MDAFWIALVIGLLAQGQLPPAAPTIRALVPVEGACGSGPCAPTVFQPIGLGHVPPGACGDETSCEPPISVSCGSQPCEAKLPGGTP